MTPDEEKFNADDFDIYIDKGVLREESQYERKWDDEEIIFIFRKCSPSDRVHAVHREINGFTINLFFRGYKRKGSRIHTIYGLRENVEEKIERLSRHV
jgi:hypothetical protein